MAEKNQDAARQQGIDYLANLVSMGLIPRSAGTIDLTPRNPLQVYNRESNMLQDHNPMPQQTIDIQAALSKVSPQQRYELQRMSFEAAVQWLRDNGLL